MASRQRKKKHTEDLEVKEKDYTSRITYFEQQVAELIHQNDNLQQERELLLRQQAEEEDRRHIMEIENTDLILKHTEETSRLRKQVQCLNERMDAGPAPAMSANPSSTGYSEFNAEMGQLNVGFNEWDYLSLDDINPDMSNEFSMPEPVVMKNAPTVEAALPHTSTRQPGNATNITADPPVASGLLFMLLLCGAFVASRSATSTFTNLPQVPEEVRIAAPAVLSTLLAEATRPSKQLTGASGHTGLEPAPSGLASSPSRADNNRMSQLHHHLTAPTKQQEIDQAFSITTAQYTSMTSTSNFLSQVEHGETTPQPRRNLAEALANMRQEAQNRGSSGAEVYTRSLLWDQIPTDVVDQFKQMVADSDEIEAKSRLKTAITTNDQRLEQRRNDQQSRHAGGVFKLDDLEAR